MESFQRDLTQTVGKNDMIEGGIYHFNNKPLMLKHGHQIWSLQGMRSILFRYEAEQNRQLGQQANDGGQKYREEEWTELCQTTGGSKMDQMLPDAVMFRTEKESVIEQKSHI